MIVYVLTSGCYSSYRIEGIYSTEEKARKQKEIAEWAQDDNWTSDLEIEEWELDEFIAGKSITVGMDRDGNSYMVRKSAAKRGYEVFFNGEKFVLNAYATGELGPDSVHVDFLNTEFSTDLNNSGGGKWEGYIWDESFINFTSRVCVFRFAANYENGVIIEDEVTVYIIRDDYWRLHRGF